MKKNYLLLCCLIALLGSCITEKPSTDCLEKVTLQFIYKADGTRNVVEKYLNCAMLLVYNENDQLVFQKSISSEELTKEHQFSMYLPIGHYNIVCWGNSNKYTTFCNVENRKTALVSCPSFVKGESIPTNDHLYYTSKSLEVEYKKENQYSLEFTSAHIDIDVFVRGTESDPYIELDNVMPQYNIHMEEAQPFTAKYTPDVYYCGEFKCFRSTLAVFRFQERCPLLLRVYIKEKQDPIEIKMSDVLKESEDSRPIATRQEAKVSVFVDYNENNLSIYTQVSDWDEEFVIPEIE
ncbi:FimB/Mfa2 family fimbrial subunit [Bacteroides coprosuis]|uniref:FimB/Mfa2 family fimbrial subunit n=1 Tax=Bacteroides coprosuis TaxID=151276 RepID=UPI001D96F3E0|nr:FimB/Mfa2 family fimbrial subunit [Bacteroides coprosuis]HJD91036.1 FimB/Mfa2 family fimbrial subunit [Bacteroides coprosuis]